LGALVKKKIFHGIKDSTCITNGKKNIKLGIFILFSLLLCVDIACAASAPVVIPATSDNVVNTNPFSGMNTDSQNGTLCQDCLIRDGDHLKPDSFLVNDFQKKILAGKLKVQGKTVQQIQEEIMSLQPPTGWRGMPTKGTVKIPVFLVDFSDAPHDPSQTVEAVQLKMFGDGNINNFPYESLRNYYQRSSYNQLTITGNVYGWYRAANPRSYYESAGAESLVNEIFQTYDSQINFADYDADHNGKIDGLFVNWAGPITGWGTFWWVWVGADYSPVTVDGVQPYKYVWSWIEPAYSRYDIHETGHLLGLPDYYDYDDTIGPKGGVGGWDMMHSNWGDHNAFSKFLLGWIDPIVIGSGTQQLILPPSGTASSNNSVLIMPDAVPDMFGEFFMVQYREPGNGNDPLQGLGDPLNKAIWIWHVDATLTPDGTGFAYDNSYTDHKLIRLMEADGMEHIEAGSGYFDVNDFYLPGQVFSANTVPDSDRYSGERTYVKVYVMEQLSDSMRVYFNAPHAPVASFTSDKGHKMAIAPFTVNFTDTSTNNPVSWFWNWGDGSTDNITVQNPLHTFTRGGKFSINLTAINPYGSNTSPNMVITVHTRPYNLQIIPDIPHGTAHVPHKIVFTGSADVYDGTLHYNWLIDGAETSNSNPISVPFDGSASGTHTIKMEVIGTYGSANMSILYNLLAASPGWKFRSDLNNSGVYDDGGTRPANVLKWSFLTGGGIHSSPAIADGVVYVGSYDGKVYALDTSTGRNLWNSTLGGILSSSPAVVNNVVFIGCSDGKVYALDALTGTVLWTSITGGDVQSSPAIADGVVYVGSCDGKVYALNATTGSKIWNYTTGGIIRSSPAVVDGIVYCGSDDRNVYALNATTGSKIWNYPTGGEILSSPAIADGVVYIGSVDSKVYALNAKAGAKIWNYTTGGNVKSSPAIADGVVYIGSVDSKVYALNAKTGSKIWNYTTSGNVESSPAIADGVVYVGSYDGKVYALDATTGEKLWYYTAGDWVVSSPAVTNGTLLVGCLDGNLYALGGQIVPIPSFTNPPTDPDSDGLYEDLNGNARKDFNDVVLMFNQMQWIATNEPVSAFDFNGNGRIDFNDIVKLFGEI
jgi:M6 family metalloprotease-like protein